jgi:hypothetical protein
MYNIKVQSRFEYIIRRTVFCRERVCSALNSDLFRKNIVNSPHCTCGAIETPTHYLFNCPHYNIPRQRHIFALNLPIPLSTELLLVGSNELTIVKKCGFIMYNIKVQSRFEYIIRRTVFCAIRKKIPRPYCLR